MPAPGKWGQRKAASGRSVHIRDCGTGAGPWALCLPQALCSPAQGQNNGGWKTHCHPQCSHPPLPLWFIPSIVSHLGGDWDARGGENPTVGPLFPLTCPHGADGLLCLPRRLPEEQHRPWHFQDGVVGPAVPCSDCCGRCGDSVPGSRHLAVACRWLGLNDPSGPGHGGMLVRAPCRVSRHRRCLSDCGVGLKADLAQCEVSLGLHLSQGGTVGCISQATGCLVQKGMGTCTEC